MQSDHAANRWLQLVAAIVGMMAIANLQYAWTLFTIPLSESLGVRLSAVQIAFTLFVLFETWLVPVEGYLIDRFGARVVVSVGSLLVAAGWIGSGVTDSIGGLYFWYALGGIGAGAVYGASMGTALKWFPDRRGLAAGLTAGAYGFGTALTIIPIQRIIDSSGYRTAFIFWGAVQGIIVLVSAQFLRKPPVSWRPGSAAGSATRSRVVQSQRSYRPAQMVRTATFWLMYAMMTMVAFGGLMVTAQLKPIAADFGMDKTILAFGVTALGLALILDRILNGVTRPFWGWISDHIGRYNTMAVAFTLEAAGIFTLLHLVHNPVGFVVLSGLVFFAWGEIYSLFPAAIGDVFGPAYATTNYGIQYTAKGTASIFAGWGAAWLVEAAGSWEPVFWVAGACDLAAAALAFFWLKPLVQKMATGPEATAPIPSAAA
ncbi:MAG TPA: oxalate/formate MFS antiporter [Vicinamibacteria bacterium]|nr:oxalate/formate MFS antiporter [Vicinamibacteria bacterium]